MCALWVLLLRVSGGGVWRHRRGVGRAWRRPAAGVPTGCIWRHPLEGRLVVPLPPRRVGHCRCGRVGGGVGRVREVATAGRTTGPQGPPCLGARGPAHQPRCHAGARRDTVFFFLFVLAACVVLVSGGGWGGRASGGAVGVARPVGDARRRARATAWAFNTRTRCAPGCGGRSSSVAAALALTPPPPAPPSLLFAPLPPPRGGSFGLPASSGLPLLPC